MKPPCAEDGFAISAVRRLADFDALAEPWREIHRADPWANPFTSWEWLRGRFAGCASPWLVLVARDRQTGRPAAFLPLRRLRGEAEPALAMAGSPLADLTGFVAPQEGGEAAIAALAVHCRDRLAARRIELKDVHDPRLPRFLSAFEASGWSIEALPGTPCPAVELERDWDSYLRRHVSAAQRESIRRKLRLFERRPGFRATSIEEGGARQVEILLDLWQKRWGRLPARHLAEYRTLFEHARCDGRLWLDLLWLGEVPVAGLLAFVDRAAGWFGFYVTGFDARYAALSPGTVMVAHSLRAAIREGFRTFDFLRGDEPYKRSFGARARFGANVVLTRTEP